MTDETCGRCGAAVSEGANFCVACGARIRGAHEARSRFMTVMFIDLVESTHITEKIGNEAMFELIERFQRLCQSVITGSGGYVAKFLGDGAMAYFGYPDAMKDSAVTAVNCATEIVRRATASLFVENEPVQISCGIATGWTVVNDMHLGEAAQEALAIGDTVNRSARLQAIAGPDEILVSSEVHRSLRSTPHSVRSVGSLRLKGIREPVEVWSVDVKHAATSAPRAGHAPEQTSTSREFTDRAAATSASTVPDAGQPAVIGRNEHLEQIATSFQDARSGRAVVVDIVAPGGYGKTSLAEEFLAAQPDAAVMRLACLSQQSEQSFACFRTLVCDLCGIAPEAPGAAEELAAWAPEGTLEGLQLLLNISTIPVAAIVRVQRIMSTLEHVFAGAIDAAPLILSVDDAHLIDSDSMRFLEIVAEKFADRPILIIIARRPEGRRLELQADLRIDLTPLLDKDAEALIALLDPADGLSPAARAGIAERAGGVPLYIHHFTLTVLEQPQTRIDNAIPETLIEALVQRFDMYGAERRLIEAAAVLGDPIPTDVVARMLGSTNEEIAPTVEVLEGRGLFRRRSAEEIEFDHALVRDAVLETLLTAQRIQLHRTALEAYCAVSPVLLERNPKIEADHLIGCENFEAAVPKLAAAAQTSTLRGEIAESVQLLRIAERLLDLIGDEVIRDQLEMTTQFALGNALVQHRGFSDASVASAYQRALELCVSNAGGSEIEFQIAWGIWAHMVVVADVRGAVQMIDRMAEIAASNPHLEVLSSAAESVMKFNLGDFDAQHVACERTQALYDRAEHGLHALTYSMDSLELSLLFEVHGRFIACDTEAWHSAYRAAREHEKALGIPLLSPYIRIFSLASNCYAPSALPIREELMEARSFAEELGQPFWVVSADLWLGAELYHQQGPVAAIEALEQALREAGKMGIQLFVRYHEALLAHGYGSAGQHDKAEQLWSAIDTPDNVEGNLMLWPELLRLRAEARHLAGVDVAEIARDLDEAEVLARKHGALAWLIKTLGTRARLDLAVDKPLKTIEDQLAEILSGQWNDHPAVVYVLNS